MGRKKKVKAKIRVTPQYVIDLAWEHLKYRSYIKYKELKIDKIMESNDDILLMRYYFSQGKDYYFEMLKSIIYKIDLDAFLKEFLAEQDIQRLFGIIEDYRRKAGVDAPSVNITL